MEEKTNFLQFACRLSNDDVDILTRQNGLNGTQISMVRSMMAYVAQNIKIHVYYKKIQDNQILAALTLGEKCDSWCESFLDEKEIWKGYMADQIAMRGMRSGYEIFRRVLENQFGTPVSQLNFFDEEKSDQTMGEMLANLEQDEIAMLHSGQMKPLKSVLFTTDILSDEPDVLSQHVEKDLCNGCGNRGCPNRITD